jgi:hypothetical protein
VGIHFQPDVLEIASEHAGSRGRTGIVDQHGDVTRDLGCRGNRRRVRDVDRHHLRTGQVDRVGIARAGVDRGATRQQLSGQLTTQSSVGPGDQGG